jgi:hypothetical protein
MFFALRAIPLIILVKLLRLRKLLKAVAESNSATFLGLLCRGLIKSFGGLELCEKLFMQFIIPYYFKDHVVLTSFVIVEVWVEAYILVHTDLTKQISVRNGFSEG